MISKILSSSVFLLCAISAWEFASVAYIHAKAELAQYLVQEAWNRNRSLNHSAVGADPAKPGYRPWPWADTWPVAKLVFPGQQVEQVVLAGATGNSLAFGPGWMRASALPGSEGMSVVAAHRDTHFALLEHIQAGDEIQVENYSGKTRYQVVERRIVDSLQYDLLLEHDENRLVLVTCYPFDAIQPGGSLRYMVIAEKR